MEYFKQIPWCQKILEAPGVVVFTPACRLKPDANGYCPSQDQLFRKSLLTEDAIPNNIGFYDKQQPATELKPHLLLNASSLLFDLRPGVNGYNGTVHGGLIAALIDEAMGNLIFMNHVVYEERLARREAIPEDMLDMRNLVMWTTGMNVRLRKPIATPQVVLVRSALSKIDGRKAYFQTTVSGEGGVVFAQCEGMWMSVAKQKL